MISPVIQTHTPFEASSNVSACAPCTSFAHGVGMNKVHIKIWSRTLGASLAAGYLGWTSPAHAQAVCSGPPYSAVVTTATCLGFSATADGGGDGQLALGASAHAGAGGAMAVGYNSFGSSLNSIALGFQAFANNANSI